MKTVRFVSIMLALSVLMAAFAPVANPVKSASASLPAQSAGSVVLNSPFFTPFTLAASAPVVSISVESLPSASAYSCSLISQSPADWTRMGRRQYFDAKWVVKNTGSRNWSTTGVDFKYISGTKMHTYNSAYDLRTNTGPGKKIALIVDMNAPKNRGYYTEIWGLVTGGNVFCRVSITVNVNH